MSYKTEYEDNNVKIKRKEKDSGRTTTIVVHKTIPDSYTSIHEGGGQGTVVHHHYSDGSDYKKDEKGNDI
ncbi:MAG: hypothetical protein FWE02_05950 [Defluviitaleaceae bacterium]|nr:hypothetical protein [Defluviitaleaceae bacterium]